MPVYTPRQASVTAKTMPVEAGAEMYSNVHGLGDVAPKRQVKYLVVFGSIVAVTVGIVLFTGKKSGNRGLSGIGELKLTRSIPAK